MQTNHHVGRVRKVNIHVLPHIPARAHARIAQRLFHAAVCYGSSGRTREVGAVLQ